MKLKLDDAGQVVVQDGKPVYVQDDGKEIAFDAAQAIGKIAALNAESKSHREGKEAAEGKLKAFEGIEDPEAARKALETIGNLDQGQLVSAGKVDEIKAAAKKAAEDAIAAQTKTYEANLAAVSTERDTFKGQLHAEIIGGAFARSKFIADKLAVPGDMVEAMFGRNFKIEDGKAVGYGADGKPIYTIQGEPAGFDDALEKMVDAYPRKDSILKGTTGAGSGAGNGGSGSGGAKTVTRTAFDAMSPIDQSAKMREGFVVTDA